MSSPVSANLLQDVEDTAVDMVMGILEGVVEEMLVDGRAPGDVVLTREQRILAFQQQVDSGEMSVLAGSVNPTLARHDAEQYVRDISKAPAQTGSY